MPLTKRGERLGETQKILSAEAVEVLIGPPISVGMAVFFKDGNESGQIFGCVARGERRVALNVSKRGGFKNGGSRGR
jgi:hypothetical protein